MTPGTQPFYLSGRRITVCPANMGDCDFTGPIEVLNSIQADGDDVPAANNPYVIEMSEHSYDIGSSQLVMKPFVDIVGKTRTYTFPTTFTVTTKITGIINNGRGYPAQDNAAVIGASNSKLENLHITNTVSGGTTTLIYFKVSQTLF